MRQRYNNNTKKPKPKENELAILKCMHFARKISRRPQVQESTAGVTYLSMRMHPKIAAFSP